MAILLTENCIGCGACKDACLPGSIELRRDPDGFMRAYISENGCTGCGRCKIVCPQLRHSRSKPQEVIAYQNPNQEVLMRSQSGGAFSALALSVLQEGGLVFGVRWNHDCSDVEYALATTFDELQEFSGSKYIPADLSSILPIVKDVVKSGRMTLFCGLPCQVAAVRNLLPRRENLLLVEILCMGPMSLTVWQQLRTQMPKNLNHFLFRDKRRRGWGYADASFELPNEGVRTFSARRYPAWQLFARGVTMSPSCSKCKFRSFDRVADITIGDFWGIETISDLPEDIRRKGISIVHAQTEIGKRYLGGLEDGILGRFSNLDEISKFNGGYLPLSARMQKRQIAFARWRERIGLPALVALSSFFEKHGRHFP